MTFFYVCLTLHIWKPCFLVDWKLLVEKHIDIIDIPLDAFVFLAFQ